jgi:hypothetical protein
MKYVLLIHQGDAPTPYAPEEWARLSEDEQKAVYDDYKAINETPGVTPADVQLQPRRRRLRCGYRTAGR